MACPWRHSASSGAGGQAALEVGTTAVAVSAEIAQRIACDASLVVMAHDAEGSVLDVGRKTRTTPPALRRALAARDGGCTFPGCGSRGAHRCEAHHLRHWAHGGTTSLENTALLCKWHHHLVHEGDYRVTRGADGTLELRRPDGWRIDAAPLLPRWRAGDEGPLGPTIARLAAAGVDLGPRTTLSHGKGEPFDVGWVIDVLRGDEPLGHVVAHAAERRGTRADASAAACHPDGDATVPGTSP